MKDTSFNYNAVAKLLHWILALAIIGMIGLGWYMANGAEHDPNRGQLFQLHKSIGITILLLSLFRLFWRLTHKLPQSPAGIAPWEKTAAKIVIILFYVLMIGVPFLGWAIVSASPRHIPTVLFGVVPWPYLPILPNIDNAKEVSEQLGAMHGYLAYAILGLLALHIAAALHHHFIKRNHILLGMLPVGLHKIFNRLRQPKSH